MLFSRKKLHDKVVVAIAVPCNKRQFQAMVDRGDSDFLRSLTEVFNTKDKNTLWSHYQRVASTIESHIHQYKKYGAEVIQELTLDRLSCIADAKVAIIIAHHSDLKDEIEMADGMVTTSNFVKAIPSNFKGLLDLSSCYSSTIQLSIKMRCPECHILAVKDKTPFQMRMTINEYVIKTMAYQPTTDYVDIVKSAYAIIMKMYSKGNVPVNPEIIFLGGSIQSSVFAPKQVERGQPFLVQVAIHKSTDAEMVEIMAREADGSTDLRNPLRLSFKLKKNDRVDIALRIDSAQKDDFKIRRSRDFFIWENEPRFTTFTVFVSEQCQSKSCFANIKICVNKLPVGEITFKSEVVSAPPKKDIAAEIDFHAYDKRVEMRDARTEMMLLLKNELDSLMDYHAPDSNSQTSQRDIDICKNSINLLEEIGTDNKKNQVLKVFISSTSDLSPYRLVMKERVLECSMYPEMYEKWPQKDKYPRDYCIEKVLMSDIFVCILGPNYGYIEPRLGTSMTEIEFRVALLSGKPILVYVLNKYEEKMQSYLPEHRHEVDKQLDLIKELGEKRMVEYFEDENTLALLSSRELTLLQTKLQSE